ncbi:hypothetical protein PQ459_10090 [Chryseobacterium sp. KACC 21268]|nr:hypothetical protein PQ459_10090 [Chryseobacterium sp. KACC 21268]
MKKILLTILLSCSIICFSQNRNNGDISEDILTITSKFDEMDGTKIFIPSHYLFLKNDNESSFINIKPVIEENLSTPYFMIEITNIGSCFENDEVDFLFENKNKLKLNSFSSYNCSGNSAFILSEENKEILSKNKIIKFRFTNGRSGENSTFELKNKNQSYFIDFFDAMRYNKLTELN